MGAEVPRRWVLRFLCGAAAAAITAPPTIVAVGSATLGDKLDPYEAKKAKPNDTIAFLFSGNPDRHAAAIAMYDEGQIDVLVILGIDEKDGAKFIKQARLKNQRLAIKKENAHGMQPAIGTAMIIRERSKICFLKDKEASVDTSTDASAACKWLLESNKNEDGWLKNKSSVTAVFISDTLHMPRCIRNLRNSWDIIPQDVRSKISFTQLTIARSKTSIFQILNERLKLGIQRTTGASRRPSILRKTANVAPKLIKT